MPRSALRSDSHSLKCSAFRSFSFGSKVVLMRFGSACPGFGRRRPHSPPSPGPSSKNMFTADEKTVAVNEPRTSTPIEAEHNDTIRNQQLVKALADQSRENEARSLELITANNELAFQNEEKEKRAAEFVIANKELVFQNGEKEKRAAELIVANTEKRARRDRFPLANDASASAVIFFDGA
jgi:hypothetical protein